MSTRLVVFIALGCWLAAAVLPAPRTHAAQKTGRETEQEAAADRTRVEHDYLLSCAGCHRFDGRGNNGVPSLAETFALVSLPGGREYLGSVPGVAQAPLDDERLAELLNWVIEEFGGGSDFRAYSAGELATLRAAPLRDPRRARTRLLGGNVE